MWKFVLILPKSRWAEGKTLHHTLGDGPKIQKRIEALAHACVDLCAKMAAPPYNAINFDINQRNILVADDMVDGDDGVPSTVTLKFIDFDAMYYKVGSEVASFEGAMLANLLSLAVHVRAMTNQQVHARQMALAASEHARRHDALAR